MESTCAKRWRHRPHRYRADDGVGGAVAAGLGLVAAQAVTSAKATAPKGRLWQEVGCLSCAVPALSDVLLEYGGCTMAEVENSCVIEALFLVHVPVVDK